MSNNKHQHIFAEDMADDMCLFALETSQEAFQLTITKGQVQRTARIATTAFLTQHVPPMFARFSRVALLITSNRAGRASPQDTVGAVYLVKSKMLDGMQNYHNRILRVWIYTYSHTVLLLLLLYPIQIIVPGHRTARGRSRSLKTNKVFTTIASFIRKAFEKAYGRGWNVVVGRSFGAYVTHEIKTYMYFTVVPGVYVLLWR